MEMGDLNNEVQPCIINSESDRSEDLAEEKEGSLINLDNLSEKKTVIYEEPLNIKSLVDNH